MSSPASSGSRPLRLTVAAAAFLLALVQVPVVGLITIFFLAGGGLVWPNQPPPSPSPFSIPAAALLLFNLLALGGFITSPRRRAWLLITAQGADLVVLVLILAMSGWWIPYALVPICAVAAIALLLMYRGLASEPESGQ